MYEGQLYIQFLHEPIRTRDTRRRELNKVYTNGTLVDADLLTDEQAGHCVAIRESDPDSDSGSFGICVLDTSTSEFNMSAFDDDACRTKLETMMRQLRVKEIVFTKVQTFSFSVVCCNTHPFSTG